MTQYFYFLVIVLKSTGRGAVAPRIPAIIAPTHLFFAYFRGLISENHCSLLDLAIATYIDPELSHKLEAN